MNDVTAVLAEVLRRKVRLESDGERLRFHPKSAVPRELRARMQRHKEEIIRILNGSRRRNGRPVPEQPQQGLAVSVIITCHNYARYLEAAILSVLGQTRPVSEILIVDDASTDHTPEVARRFQADGVGYLRVELRSPHAARKTGLDATQGDIALFLDADNYLSRDYVERGLARFTHRNVGVVYADLQQFGSFGTARTNFPEFSRGRLFRSNFVDACALIRREALEITNAFEFQADGVFYEDYLLFQRLCQEGWEFRKQDAVVMYRTHDRQRTALLRKEYERAGYFETHGLGFQHVTLFLPLAGRPRAWREMRAFLNRQTWPHDAIRLILCDTSQDPAFSRQVREWIAACDYSDVRHFTYAAAVKGLADENRRNFRTELAVQRTMCRIYNRLRSALETDYCWILEDDVIPPDDVLERLLGHFRPDVGSVCAPYLSRWDRRHVVWLADAPPGRPFGAQFASRPRSGESSLMEVRGSGFGCLVLRSELIKAHVFSLPRREMYYDPYFFRTMGDEWKRLCDWSCECRHIQPAPPAGDNGG